MTQEAQSEWYAAYLSYLLESGSSGRAQGAVRIQEDLILIEAPTSDQAHAKALQLGAEVGRFGHDLLEGRPEALREIGLDSESQINPWPHPGLADVYHGFAFLGLRDLVPLPARPGHGVEVDRHQRTMELNQAESLRTPKRALRAFKTAGPAHVGQAKTKEEARLFERYEWYLAEQIFSPGSATPAHGAVTVNVVERLVLLNVNNPDKAFQEAVLDASVWEQKCHPTASFIGLRQLELIQGDLKDGCELRTLIVEVQSRHINQFAKARSSLTAFRPRHKVSGGTQGARVGSDDSDGGN